MLTNKIVISLDIRKDRLEQFFNNWKPYYPSDDFQVYKAIHGDTCTPPKFWNAGNGAWGCYKSHLNILETQMNEHTESYCVFEDDAIPSAIYDEYERTVLAELPDDWEMFYIGGQLLHEWDHPPKQISDNIYIPYNVNRTHGFMVHSRGYKKLYNHLCNVPFENEFHIDHHLGRIHESAEIKVYVPGKWLIGQAGSSSNVSGKVSDTIYWNDPETVSVDNWLFKRPVVIHLISSPEIAAGLRERGWHQGNWLNEEGLDNGICKALHVVHPLGLLEEWYNCIRREVVRDNKKYPCLYHPHITSKILDQIRFAHIVHIEADSIESAEAQAEAHPLLTAWRTRNNRIAAND